MRSRSLPVTVRAAVWASFLVLAGLLLMHGLGSHGSMADEHGDMAPMAMGTSSTTVSVGLTATLQPETPTSGSDQMASMCVVVLTLAVAIGLWLSGLLHVPRSHTLLPRLRHVARLAQAPDPPSLVKLSVCRC